LNYIVLGFRVFLCVNIEFIFSHEWRPPTELLAVGDPLVNEAHVVEDLPVVGFLDRLEHGLFVLLAQVVTRKVYHQDAQVVIVVQLLADLTDLLYHIIRFGLALAVHTRDDLLLEFDYFLNSFVGDLLDEFGE
jgi:hypothetical protein